jgi:penicillin-binding protein 2
MGTYPPGSTFKTSQALTFLEEGILTPETPLTCSNGFVFNNFRLGCHAHASPTTLKPAIATSCNAYFCWGLHRMFGSSKYEGGTKEAMNVWRDYMVSMGFGYKLGVDLPGEVRGMIPNAQFYDKAYRSSWNGLTVISISIGQGEVTLTPLQIANLCATIANRGTFVTPHVVKNIEGDTLASTYLTPRATLASRNAYESVVAGMRQAVLAGTCRGANLPDIEVCGKTGTAQNKGKDHSAFIGFAPMDNPQIAISVYIEHGGFGADVAAPMAALIIEEYLKGELSKTSEEKAKRLSSLRF